MIAVPAASVGPTRAALRTGTRVHLVSGRDAVSDVLSLQLEASGASVSIGADLPSGAEDFVFLRGLTARADEAEAVVMEVFRALRTLGQRAREEAVRVFVVIDTGGDFGLHGNPGERAMFGALAGLAKTAAREWPKATVRVIDVANAGDAAATAQWIGEEICGGSTEDEVGLGAAVADKGAGAPSRPRLRGGSETGTQAVSEQRPHRVVPQLQPVERRGTREATRALTAGGLWVVSGGARGVTAACVQALAGRVALRFLLLGRSAVEGEESDATRSCRTDAELKQALLAAARASGETITPRELQRRASAILAAREVRETTAALARAGAEVRYVGVDIADERAVATAVAAARAEWGPVRGVVHAAGVLADKALHEKTDEQFASVWRTKVRGFRALLAATREDPLEVLCAFSSVAARMGNVGQADYAAANEALNKLCQAEQHRRGTACRVRAINWGPWDGGMVTAALKTHFTARGVPLIPVDAGAAVFADIVTGVREVAVESVVGGLLTPRENGAAAT